MNFDSILYRSGTQQTDNLLMIEVTGLKNKKSP
jgi:hypothetical protein